MAAPFVFFEKGRQRSRQIINQLAKSAVTLFLTQPLRYFFTFSFISEIFWNLDSTVTDLKSASDTSWASCFFLIHLNILGHEISSETNLFHFH